MKSLQTELVEGVLSDARTGEVERNGARQGVSRRNSYLIGNGLN